MIPHTSKYHRGLLAQGMSIDGSPPRSIPPSTTLPGVFIKRDDELKRKRDATDTDEVKGKVKGKARSMSPEPSLDDEVRIKSAESTRA